MDCYERRAWAWAFAFSEWRPEQGIESHEVATERLLQSRSRQGLGVCICWYHRPSSKHFELLNSIDKDIIILTSGPKLPQRTPTTFSMPGTCVLQVALFRENLICYSSSSDCVWQSTMLDRNFKSEYIGAFSQSSIYNFQNPWDKWMKIQFVWSYQRQERPPSIHDVSSRFRSRSILWSANTNFTAQYEQLNGIPSCLECGWNDHLVALLLGWQDSAQGIGRLDCSDVIMASMIKLTMTGSHFQLEWSSRDSLRSFWPPRFNCHGNPACSRF